MNWRLSVLLGASVFVAGCTGATNQAKMARFDKIELRKMLGLDFSAYEQVLGAPKHSSKSSTHNSGADVVTEQRTYSNADFKNFKIVKRVVTRKGGMTNPIAPDGKDHPSSIQWELSIDFDDSKHPASMSDALTRVGLPPAATPVMKTRFGDFDPSTGKSETVSYDISPFGSDSKKFEDIFAPKFEHDVLKISVECWGTD